MRIQRFLIFVKLLYASKNLRFKIGPLKVAAGNKLKKLELELLPYEGEYRVEFKNTNICILLERGSYFLVGEFRQSVISKK